MKLFAFTTVLFVTISGFTTQRYSWEEIQAISKSYFSRSGRTLTTKEIDVIHRAYDYGEFDELAVNATNATTYSNATHATTSSNATNTTTSSNATSTNSSRGWHHHYGQNGTRGWEHNHGHHNRSRGHQHGHHANHNSTGHHANHGHHNKTHHGHGH